MPIQNERRDATKNRIHILKTAQALFDQYGIDKVSMHRIAKTAGIGQGTLYRKYNHKADLCFDLMKEHYITFKTETDSYLEGAKSTSVRERLEEVIKRVFSFLEDNLQWLTVIQQETGAERNQKNVLSSPTYVYIHSIIQQLMEEGVATGVCRKVDPCYSAYFWVSSLTPDLISFLQQDKGYTLPQQYESYCLTYIEPLFNPNP